jgi:hypothetical protein
MDAETSRTPILVSTEDTSDKDQNNSASEVGDGRVSSPVSIGHVHNEDQDDIIQEALSSSDDEDDVPRKHLCKYCNVSVPTDLWDTHIETAMHQQNIPATDAASNRLPPVGIVMPNLSLMVSPDRRKRALQLGIMIPDLSLDVESDQQMLAGFATDADSRPSVTEVTENPTTGYDLSSVDNDMFDAALALIQLSRSGGDRDEGS